MQMHAFNIYFKKTYDNWCNADAGKHLFYHAISAIQGFYYQPLLTCDLWERTSQRCTYDITAVTKRPCYAQMLFYGMNKTIKHKCALVEVSLKQFGGDHLPEQFHAVTQCKYYST